MKHKSNNCPGLWELAVLSLLQEQAMHPYEIQRLLKARHKDAVLVLKRGSLYHAIRRLEHAGLIEHKETTREGRRPERMTYRITKTGKQAQAGWLKQMVSTPQHERSDFMGAISFLPYLTPAETAEGLHQRVALLEKELAGLDATLAAIRPKIGRIHLIETEYARAMRAAELQWVRELSADLRAGRFTWNLENLLHQARITAAQERRKKKTEAK